jgi:hypothetical protein
MRVDAVLDAGGRRLRARLAAFTSWSNTSDPAARTAPARAAALKRFEDAVDPDRKLPAEERARRAEAARRAWFTRLAYASAKARSSGRTRRVKAITGSTLLLVPADDEALVA